MAYDKMWMSKNVTLDAYVRVHLARNSGNLRVTGYRPQEQSTLPREVRRTYLYDMIDMIRYDIVDMVEFGTTTTIHY